jgi:hypothetical protein
MPAPLALRGMPWNRLTDTGDQPMSTTNNTVNRNAALAARAADERQLSGKETALLLGSFLALGTALLSFLTL